MEKQRDAIEDLLEYCDRKTHLTKGKELADVLIGQPCATADEWDLAEAMKRLLEQELAHCRKKLGIDCQVTENVVEHQATLRAELLHSDPDLRSWNILWAHYICHLLIFQL